MGEWWTSLSLLQQIFACMAIPATIILLIQSILLLFGMSGEVDGDLDGSFDATSGADAQDIFDGAGDGLSLFTLRGIVAFFAVGGWSGMALAEHISSVWIVILVSFAAGFAALYGIALLFRAILRLQSSGNINFAGAVGKTAKVYIKIGADGSSTGKVTMTLAERFLELDAVTKDPSDIRPGEIVTVTGQLDDATLVVTKRKKEGK